MLRSSHSILVTGGAGFIGSAFIRYLLTQISFQGKIVNLDRLTYAGSLIALKEVECDPRYTFVEGDIRDRNLLEKLYKEFQFDVLVHFAAETHVDRSITHPQPFLESNVLGTCELLEFVKTHKEIHFHHISTDEVYGSLGEEGTFSERSPYLPNSPYSASKAASDHFVRAYHVTYGISTTLSHCSNNFGPFQNEEKLIPKMILHCLEGKPLPIYGKGQNIRDWIYVEDHVEAIWNIIQKGKSGEVYDIGGENEIKNIDLLHMIIGELSHVSQKPVQDYLKLICYVPDRPGHDYRYALSNEKIKKQLGFSPKVSLKEGIQKTVLWYDRFYHKKEKTFVFS